jgi:hypothetical protein
VSLVLGDLLGYLLGDLSLSLGYLHSHKRMGPTEVRAVRDLSHEWDWSVRLSVRTVVSSNTKGKGMWLLTFFLFPESQRVDWEGTMVKIFLVQENSSLNSK